MIEKYKALEAENERLKTLNVELTAKCNWYNRDGARLERERDELTRQRDEAVQMLADWCDAVRDNGTGWDDWDEHYKEAAPVIASEQKPVAWVDVIDRHEGPYNFNGLELLDSGKHLLFTSPPNTADIEQRTAEAIAKMIQGWSCTNGPSIAEAIRSGKWREYL